MPPTDTKIVEKTCEELNWTGKPELFALVAFQQGAIDASQLRKAIRLWLEGDQADLEVVLVEAGFVSATVHKKLLVFLENNRKLDDVRVAPTEKAITTNSSRRHNKVASDELDRKVRRRVDSAHAQSSETAPSHRKRAKEPSSYYDSFHEQFTREEKFLPGLFRHFSTAKRKFKRNIHQLRQGSIALAEIVLDWFFAYYQRLILSLIGLLFIGASVYYLNQWLSNADAKPLAAGSSNRQPIVNGSEPKVSPARVAADPQPNSPTPPLQAATAAKQSEDAAEVVDDSSEISNQTLGQSVPASVARVSSSDSNEKSSIRQQQLAKVSQILTNNDPELAVSFLESTLENVTGDKQDLEEALVASLLSAKDFDRAGERLVHPQLLDCESPTWDLMFTCWLLYAPEASRLSVAGKLALVAESVPFSESLQNVMLRIKIRNGEEMIPMPQSASPWFSDVLFQSVAAHKSGNRQLAIEQLNQARQQFDEAWSRVDVADPSQLAARVGRKMIDAALTNYAQVVAK